MKYQKIILCLTLVLGLVFADFEVKISDITYIQGIKKNRVSGYGLVVGLDGTGDSRSALTRKTINQYLVHSGLDIQEHLLTTRNSAVVAVTAELNGFISKGDLLDVNVASIGDAKAVDNGLLLQTVLRGPDGNTYVVAGGVVDSGPDDGNNKKRGIVASGGIVERPAGTAQDYIRGSSMVLILKNPGLDTASLIKEAVEKANANFQVNIADYKRLNVQSSAGNLTYKEIAAVLDLKITIKSRAKVIIDKQSGIVVVGDNVRVDTAFVSLPGVNIEIEEDQKINNVIKNNNTVSELAAEFNQIGIKPRDIIAVFQALKKCGAINADIIIQ